MSPAFPEITDENYLIPGKMAGFHGVSILEGGMASGKTSIGIVLQLPDGKYVMSEISADMWRTITAAIDGAEESFKSQSL